MAAWQTLDITANAYVPDVCLTAPSADNKVTPAQAKPLISYPFGAAYCDFYANAQFTCAPQLRGLGRS
jgi:hypothetical protein